MNVLDIIRSVSDKYQIPSWIPETIARAESSLNPREPGDNGTSFGLFQLHRGGLAPSSLSNEQLYDPQTNTEIAIPHMLDAYHDAVKHGLNGFDLVQYVANNSGWPTMAGTAKTPAQYNQRLLTAYNQTTGNFLGVSSTGDFVKRLFGLPTNTPVTSPQWTPSQSYKDFTDTVRKDPYGFITGVAGKVGYFVGGLVAIILGFVLLAKGGTNE